MRISDWSSDVCSSDLKTSHLDLPHRYIPWPIPGFQFCRNTIAWGITTHRYGIPGVCAAVLIYDVEATGGDWGHGTPRSEEHTSELQSLMRTSYAVFCLNKNKKQYQ